MTITTGYDFLSWTSFPSSAKLFSDETNYAIWMNYRIPGLESLVVTPGAKLKVQLNAKQEGLFDLLYSHFSLNEAPVIPKFRRIGIIALPRGTFPWRTFETEVIVPADVNAIAGYMVGGSKGTTWFDDLKIYQDGVLIYSNDFSKWDPMIGAGIGAPIGGVAGYLLKEPLGPIVSEVVGAVLGGALGGGVGLLTGLGIIPVPQIPALGATLEEPEAPTQLGKYQITG